MVPGYIREPLTGEFDVVVGGGGFGGLLTGARLREAGVKDVRLIEKGRRLWRHLALGSLSRRRLRW